MYACILYRTLFYVDLYFTYIFILDTFVCVSFVKANVSFKCQEKKCPAEHEEDSKLNKRSKIALRIVSVVVLA